MAKIVKLKWIQDPPPPWLIRNKDLLSKFQILGNEFEKKIDAVHQEFIQKVNGMKQ